MPPRGMKKGT